MKTVWTWFKQNYLWVGGTLAMVATLVYILVLAFFPITFFPLLEKFGVPENAKVDPYLARAITLTFGFLATWLILKYMFGLDVLMRLVGLNARKKFLAFAGLVAVGILYNLTLWWLTTAETRRKASELQEQIQAQQAQIAQLAEKAAQEEEQGNKTQREDVPGGHTEGKYASGMSALPRWVGTTLWVLLAIGGIFFLWFFGVPWVAYNLTLLIAYANWKGDPCLRGTKWPGFRYGSESEHLDMLKNLCYAILLSIVVVLLCFAICGLNEFFCAILILAILVIAAGVVLCFLNW